MNRLPSLLRKPTFSANNLFLQCCKNDGFPRISLLLHHHRVRLFNTSIRLSAGNDAGEPAEVDLSMTKSEESTKKSITARLQQMSIEEGNPDKPQSNKWKSYRGNSRVVDEFDEEDQDQFDENEEYSEDETGRRGDEIGKLEQEVPAGEVESISDRLRRLSMSNPQEFVPSPATKGLRQRVQAKYAKLNSEYEMRYSSRGGNSYYGGRSRPSRPSGFDDDDDGGWGVRRPEPRSSYGSYGGGSRRYLTTCAGSCGQAGGDDNGSNPLSITERLRHLSAQNPDTTSNMGFKNVKPWTVSISNNSKYPQKDNFRGRQHSEDNFQFQRSSHDSRFQSRENTNDRFSGKQWKQSLFTGDRRNQGEFSTHPEQTHRQKFQRDRGLQMNNLNRMNKPKHFGMEEDIFQDLSQFQNRRNQRDGVRFDKPSHFGGEEQLKKFREHSQKYPRRLIKNLENKQEDTEVDFEQPARMGPVNNEAYEAQQDAASTTADPDSEILPKVNDPDKFGTLRFSHHSSGDNIGLMNQLASEDKDEATSLFAEEEGDDVVFKPEERMHALQLRRGILACIQNKELKEAIDLLTTAMAQGGFHYDHHIIQYCYSVVIAECGKVGYVKMAFKLFNDLKKRGFLPKPAMYTSLFNACANSPWDVDENLLRIKRLRLAMEDTGLLLNEKHFHSIIKAYGRLGQIDLAFGIVDEMTSNNLPITGDTFCFLLQACITDKENGFRHLLVTWRKMQEMRIRPSIFSYTLLLRCVRECYVSQFGQISSTNERKIESDQPPGNTLEFSEDDQPTTISKKLRLPAIDNDQDGRNLLDVICQNDDVSLKSWSTSENDVALIKSNNDLIKALKYKENRLSVFGGPSAIFKAMEQEGVSPNLIVFTELVQSAHTDDIDGIIKEMENYKVKPDIDFFNMVLRKYQPDKQELAAGVLLSLPKYELIPNIMTWGIMALGCRSWTAARCMLAEMDETNVLPNREILGALMTNACHNYDPIYVLRMLEEVRIRELKPGVNFLMKVDEFKKTVQRGIISKEMGEPVEPARLANAINNDRFEENFAKFKLRFDVWARETAVLIEPKDPFEEDFKARYSGSSVDISNREHVAAIDLVKAALKKKNDAAIIGKQTFATRLE